jgi:iron complex outermembrane receptor protein
MIFQRILLALIVLVVTSLPAVAQANGTLRGTATLGETGKPVHHVLITILQLKRSVDTDEDGKYEFTDVPPGKYDVVAHLDRVPDSVQSIDVTAGAAATLEQSLSSSIQSVDVLGSVELAKKSPVSLGEALDGELGVAKRSFGPGTARPVIRGFDGDRVLILQDGNRAGGLGFESGDHAEPVDVLTVERVEIVKGPATLLYGSNAIGVS